MHAVALEVQAAKPEPATNAAGPAAIAPASITQQRRNATQQQQQQQSQQPSPLSASSSTSLIIKDDPSSTHDSNSMPGAAAPTPPPKPPLLQRLKAIGRDHFMPISFLIATILAISWPVPGAAVASWQGGNIRIVQAINNALVFLISGLTLRSDDFRAMLRHWVGVLFGFVAILVITPCLGFGLVRLPLQPPEFAVGLAIFSVVPTTLGVGVALTAASKGNQVRSVTMEPACVTFAACVRLAHVGAAAAQFLHCRVVVEGGSVV